MSIILLLVKFFLDLAYSTVDIKKLLLKCLFDCIFALYWLTIFLSLFPFYLVFFMN